ncbi:MAG: polymer-forming cytoskeletal protein [Phycisphaerales bacterium]|nr:MAG: polymer-forming cytoskeletal protein [Phycisphaerales bacterium]
MADSGQDFGTIIGPDASFKGDLTFNSAAKVLGSFEGSIISKGKIHIADGAKCKATINAKEVAIEGRVEGNVEAGERIEIKPTGAITGDITATRMSMADGASIDGHCRIGLNGQATAGAKASSATEVKPKAEPGKASGQPEPVATGKK